MPAIDREPARAKLTRRFRVTGRRDDGYHLISSEMVTLDLADEVELSEGTGIEIVDAVDWSGDSERAVSLDGLATSANLAVRALELAGRRAHLRLVKRIPPGSGLGGGSADAAAVLRWAGVTDPALAARLGADVPFCLAGGRAAVSGVGEVVEPMRPIQLEVVLLIPALSVSTADVYGAFDDVGPGDDDASVNDLEGAAIEVEPRLKRFRDLLAAIGNERPQLAGSGATWFIECRSGAGAELASAVREALVAEGMTAAVAATKAES